MEDQKKNEAKEERQEPEVVREETFREENIAENVVKASFFTRLGESHHYVINSMKGSENMREYLTLQRNQLILTALAAVEFIPVLEMINEPVEDITSIGRIDKILRNIGLKLRNFGRKDLKKSVKTTEDLIRKNNKPFFEEIYEDVPDIVLLPIAAIDTLNVLPPPFSYIAVVPEIWQIIANTIELAKHGKPIAEEFWEANKNALKHLFLPSQEVLLAATRFSQTRVKL